MVKLFLVDQITKWATKMLQDDDLIQVFFAIPKHWWGTHAAGNICIHVVFMIEPRWLVCTSYLQSNLSSHPDISPFKDAPYRDINEVSNLSQSQAHQIHQI